MCIDYGMIDFVIDLAYDNNEKVRKMMDEAPYYGEKIHYLLPLLNDVYNVEEYKEIIAENNIHKLSYKVKLKDEINGSCKNKRPYKRNHYTTDNIRNKK